jgi:hypothetical protein
MTMLTFSYDELVVDFTEKGWINATKLSKAFNKRLDSYFENLETKEYIEIRCEMSNLPVTAFIKKREGRYGGTWLHPKISIHFNRWLNIRFAIWCDDQIEIILKSPKEYAEWVRYRHETASSNKVLNAVIKETLEESGIEALPENYVTEALMINQAMTGDYCSIERDKLCKSNLDLLGKLEIKNAVLFARQVPYEHRKGILERFAREWQEKHR